VFDSSQIAEFIEIVRAPIERGDWWFLPLIERLVETFLGSGISRDDLAHALLREFPNNDLAERAANQIIFPEPQ
jgi:hypothetical protein